MFFNNSKLNFVVKYSSSGSLSLSTQNLLSLSEKFSCFIMEIFLSKLLTMISLLLLPLFGLDFMNGYMRFLSTSVVLELIRLLRLEIPTLGIFSFSSLASYKTRSTIRSTSGFDGFTKKEISRDFQKLHLSIEFFY